LGTVLFVIGYWIGGVHTALAALAWGMFLRLVFVLHSTWFVNSASHMWGYRNYETRDNSRNLWWVALLAYGEGWHNNHHAYPAMARHGHKWWEFDATFQFIRLLACLGLAWDVVDDQHKKPAQQRDSG
jgi:stearoyl-CoA desaturase (delta-9 desaturase)